MRIDLQTAASPSLPTPTNQEPAPVSTSHYLDRKGLSEGKDPRATRCCIRPVTRRQNRGYIAFQDVTSAIRLKAEDVGRRINTTLDPHRPRRASLNRRLVAGKDTLASTRVLHVDVFDHIVVRRGSLEEGVAIQHKGGDGEVGWGVRIGPKVAPDRGADVDQVVLFTNYFGGDAEGDACGFAELRGGDGGGGCCCDDGGGGLGDSLVGGDAGDDLDDSSKGGQGRCGHGNGVGLGGGESRHGRGDGVGGGHGDGCCGCVRRRSERDDAEALARINVVAPVLARGPGVVRDIPWVVPAGHDFAVAGHFLKSGRARVIDGRGGNDDGGGRLDIGRGDEYSRGLKRNAGSCRCRGGRGLGEQQRRGCHGCRRIRDDSDSIDGTDNGSHGLGIGAVSAV